MLIFHEANLALFVPPVVTTHEVILDLVDKGAEQDEGTGYLKWREAGYAVAVVVENPYVRLCRLYDIYANSLRDRKITPKRWSDFVEDVTQEVVEPYLRATITDWLVGFDPDYVISINDLYLKLSEIVDFSHPAQEPEDFYKPEEVEETEADEDVIASQAAEELDEQVEGLEVVEEVVEEVVVTPTLTQRPRDYSKYLVNPQVRTWCNPDAEAFGYAGKLLKNLPLN